jgi:hypothetical protein
MKHLILLALFLTTASAWAAPTVVTPSSRGIAVDANGVLTAPSNLWSTNRGGILSAIGGGTASFGNIVISNVTAGSILMMGDDGILTNAVLGSGVSLVNGVLSATGGGGGGYDFDVYATTTDATALPIYTNSPPTNVTVHLHYWATGGGPTNYAHYERDAILQRFGSAPAIVSSNATSTIESQAGFDVYSSISGNTIRLNVKGQASESMKWRLYGNVTYITNGLPTAAVGGTYLVDEDFEGTGAPSGWFGGGSANFDSTSPALVGSQSLRVNGATSDYAVYTLSSDQPELWLKFKYRLESSLPSSSFNILFIEDAGFTKIFSAAILTDGTIAVDCGGGPGFGQTSGSMAANTDYFVWGHLKKGSGATAQIEFAFNTSNSRPTSGANHIAVTSGITATDIHDIKLTIDAGSAQDFDSFQIATEVFE